MNATQTLRLTAFASLLSVAVFAPQARAVQAQAQSDEAASSYMSPEFLLWDAALDSIHFSVQIPTTRPALAAAS